MVHKVCKNKKWIQTDNCIKKMEDSIKEKHIRKAYTEAGSL